MSLSSDSNKLSKQISFIIEANQRFISYQGTKYEDVFKLLKENIELKDFPLDIARSINFICHGLEYNIIEDPDQYRKLYEGDLVREKDYPRELPQRESWGEFTVSQIETPHWEGSNLVFCAERSTNRIPYKITYVPEDSFVSYKPLRP